MNEFADKNQNLAALAVHLWKKNIHPNVPVHMVGQDKQIL